MSDLSPGAVEGATNPLVAVVATETGDKEEVVLKPTAPWTTHTGQVVPGETLNVREVCCGLLLRAVGLDAPEPFVITGAALPWTVIAGRHAPRLNAVPHFATSLIKNARECAVGERLERFVNDTLLAAAEDIFAADNVIVNCDRTRFRPNLWWRSDALIPIDHGLAFAALGLNPGFVAIPADLQREHVTYDILEGAPRSFERSMGAWVQQLSAETITALRDALPAEWLADRTEIDRISAHLQAHPARMSALTHAIGFWFASPNA